MPVWHPGLTREWLAAVRQFVDYFVTFRGFNAGTPPSIGSNEDLEPFRDLTRARLAPSPGAFAPTTPHQTALNAWKVATLQTIGDWLCRGILWFVLAAHLAALVRAAQLVWQRRLTYLFVVAAAAWAACAAYLLLNALVHVTSFPTLTVVYLHAAYPLLLLFVIAIFLDVATKRQPHSARLHQ